MALPSPSARNYVAGMRLFHVTVLAVLLAAGLAPLVTGCCCVIPIPASR